MANYHAQLLVQDLEEHTKPISSYIVAATNTAAATLLGGFATFADGHIDGVISAANLERKIPCTLPASLKTSAAAGSRIEEKMAIEFGTESDNPDKNRMMSLPARTLATLEGASKYATAAFVTAATTLFVKTATPFFCDDSFNHFSSLKTAKEDYNSRASKND